MDRVLFRTKQQQKGNDSILKDFDKNEFWWWFYHLKIDDNHILWNKIPWTNKLHSLEKVVWYAESPTWPSFNKSNELIPHRV